MNKKQLDVLKRVHDFLGVLIREDLIKDAPFLEEEPSLMVSDLADDLYDCIFAWENMTYKKGENNENK